MPRLKLKDIDKPDGWMVKVTKPGSDFIHDVRRYFYTFEPDRDKALALVRVADGETAEAIRSLYIQDMARLDMKPGDVKYYA
jgi:hypothetical protein